MPITTVRQPGSPGFAQPACLEGRVKQTKTTHNFPLGVATKIAAVAVCFLLWGLCVVYAHILYRQGGTELVEVDLWNE